MCKKMFLRDTTLNIHMKSHFQCNKCGSGFNKEHSLTNHKKSIHNCKPEKPLVKEVPIEDKSTTC